MSLVRHFEDVLVCHPAFDRVAVEQRRPRRAAYDKGHFPGDIGRVHERRIETLAPEGARQMSCVAQQKSPPVTQTLGGPLVHLKMRNPLQVVHINVGAGARVQQRSQRIFGRKLSLRVRPIAIDEDKPTLVGKR
jgi:hypothetical protein